MTKQLAIGLMTMAMALAAGVDAAAQRGEIIEKIIVKVNGEIFTQTQLEQAQIDALREQNRRVNDPALLQSDAALRQALTELTPRLIVDAIEELLLMQRARDLNVRFTDEAFQEALENVKKQNNLNDEQLKAAMAQEGLTMEGLRQNFEREYMTQAVTQLEIVPRLQVTDEELRQYYRANPDEFMQPESVMLREIFVAVPTETRDGQEVVNAAAQEDAQKKIATARARVVGGEDFAAVAAEVSESASKSNGGLIGPVETSVIAPALREVISALAVGDVSEPIRTARGYQVLKLESRSEAAPQAFAQIREQILLRIRGDRVDREMTRYLETLRAQAQIEWKDDTYKALYEKALAERGARGSSGAR